MARLGRESGGAGDWGEVDDDWGSDEWKPGPVKAAAAKPLSLGRGARGSPSTRPLLDADAAGQSSPSPSATGFGSSSGTFRGNGDTGSRRRAGFLDGFPANLEARWNRLWSSYSRHAQPILKLGAVVVLAVFCLIVACVSVALMQTRSAYTTSFGSVLDDPPAKLASSLAAPLSDLNGGGGSGRGSALTGAADALGNSVGQEALSGSVLPKSKAAAAAVGGGHGAAERSRGDEAFMSTDHSARLEGHLAGQAVDVHSGGVLGGGIESLSKGGLGKDGARREDLETVSQPREFFSPDDLKRGSGSGNGDGSGNSRLAVAPPGGRASSVNGGGGKSVDGSSGGAGLLRDGSNNAAKASGQAGAQESSSTYQKHLIDYNLKQGIGETAGAPGLALEPEVQALLATGLIRRHDGSGSSGANGDSSEALGDGVRSSSLTGGLPHEVDATLVQDRQNGTEWGGNLKVARQGSETTNAEDANPLDPDAEGIVGGNVDTSSLGGIGSGGASLAIEKTDGTSYSARSNKQAASDGTDSSGGLRGNAGASGLGTADEDSAILAANTLRTSTIGSRSSSHDSSSSNGEALGAWDDQPEGSRNAGVGLVADDALAASNAADALEDSSFGGAAAGALPGGDSRDGGADAGGRGHSSVVAGQSAATHSSAGKAAGLATGRKGSVDQAKAASDQLATTSDGSARSKSAERVGVANVGAGDFDDEVDRSQGNLSSGKDSVSVTGRSADDSDRVSTSRAKSGSFNRSSSSDVGPGVADSTNRAAKGGTSFAIDINRDDVGRNGVFDSSVVGSSGSSAGESAAQPDGQADLDDEFHGPKGSRGTAKGSSGTSSSRGGSREGSSSKKGTSSAAVKSAGHLDAPLNDKSSSAHRAEGGGDGSRTGTTAVGKPATMSDEKPDGLSVDPSASNSDNELQLDNDRMAGADETVSRSRDQERRELIGGATKSAPLMTGGGVGSSSGHASRINSVLAAEAIQDNSATSQDNIGEGTDKADRARAHGSGALPSETLDEGEDASATAAAPGAARSTGSSSTGGSKFGGKGPGGREASAKGSRMSAELAATAASAPGPVVEPGSKKAKHGKSRSSSVSTSSGAGGRASSRSRASDSSRSDGVGGSTKGSDGGGRPRSEDLKAHGSGIAVDRVSNVADAAAGKAGQAAAAAPAASAPIPEDAASSLAEAARNVTSAAGKKAGAVLSGAAKVGAAGFPKAGSAAGGAAAGARLGAGATGDATAAETTGATAAAGAVADSALDSGSVAAQSAGKAASAVPDSVSAAKDGAAAAPASDSTDGKVLGDKGGRKAGGAGAVLGGSNSAAVSDGGKRKHRDAKKAAAANSSSSEQLVEKALGRKGGSGGSREAAGAVNTASGAADGGRGAALKENRLH